MLKILISTEAVNSIWGPFTVDCFVNSVNAKVPRFYSLFFQPGCLGVDALAFDWGGENCWLVPGTFSQLQVSWGFGRPFLASLAFLALSYSGKRCI